MSFYAERLKYGDKEEPVASLAPRRTKEEGEPAQRERSPVLPPGF